MPSVEKQSTDEAKFNETLKRMLDKKPVQRKTSGEPKPPTHGSGQEEDQKSKSPKAPG